MKSIIIQGHWKGVITLGPEYGEAHGKKLTFEASIEQNGNEFSGVAKDIEGFGVNPDPAHLKGHISGHRIHFIKQYASFQYAEEDPINDNSIKGPKIKYEGTLSNSHNEIIGTWNMPPKWKLFRPISIKASGTWEMQRV